MITVAELIAILEKLPPGADVVFDGNGCASPVHAAEYDMRDSQVVLS